MISKGALIVLGSMLVLVSAAVPSAAVALMALPRGRRGRFFLRALSAAAGSSLAYEVVIVALAGSTQIDGPVALASALLGPALISTSVAIVKARHSDRD